MKSIEEIARTYNVPTYIEYKNLPRNEKPLLLLSLRSVAFTYCYMRHIGCEPPFYILINKTKALEFIEAEEEIPKTFEGCPIVYSPNSIFSVSVQY